MFHYSNLKRLSQVLMHWIIIYGGHYSCVCSVCSHQCSNCDMLPRNILAGFLHSPCPPEVIDGYCKIINPAFIIFPCLFVFQSYSLFRVSVLTQGPASIIKVGIIAVISRHSHQMVMFTHCCAGRSGEAGGANFSISHWSGVSLWRCVEYPEQSGKYLTLTDPSDCQFQSFGFQQFCKSNLWQL